MNNYERMIPRSFKPISAWGYVGYSILYAIPVLGWIFLFIHAIGAENRNVRSYARSYFCNLLLVAIIAVVCGGILVALFTSGVISMDMFNELIGKLPTPTL